MPAGRGNDAERFAAALEQGRSPGYHADAELAHELEIVAMLRASGSAYAPSPDAKARSRARVLAALAAENGAGELAPTAMEMTLPISDSRLAPTPRNRSDALRDQEEAPAEITSRIAPIEEPAFEDESYDYDDSYDDSYEDDSYDDHDEPEVEERSSSAHGAVRSRSGRRVGRHTMPSRPARLAGSARPGRRSRSPLRRIAVTASFALLALVAVAGGGMFASRDALPGDTLYGVKRVAESAGTALTFDDAARATRHLQLASTRLNEVEQLVDHKRTTQADPALLSDAILDFDSATGEGSTLILTEDEAHDPARLADLQAWAAEQVSRLSTLRSGLPVSAQTEVDHSIELLDKLRQRAAELEDRASCEDVTSGHTDDVGPIPATTDCDPSAGDDDSKPSTQPSRSGGSGSGTSGGPTSGPKGLLPGLLDGSSSPSASSDDDDATDGTSSAAPTTSASINVPLPLPLLPPINLPPLLPGGRGITIG
ncbi:DUF5667 domain-containing protein [Pseudonocardia sp. CA-107938]|uniref:DUF5667 domain-containing protein n=1 Tax=Pseudonocardia sp. CA-107938 TaxID=3240021 RepID=UPI003D8D0547